MTRVHRCSLLLSACLGDNRCRHLKQLGSLLRGGTEVRVEAQEAREEGQKGGRARRGCCGEGCEKTREGGGWSVLSANVLKFPNIIDLLIPARTEESEIPLRKKVSHEEFCMQG